MERKRIEWIDLAKGFGILLVILGHLEIGPLKYTIYSFHIPLFFFLSGFLFKTEKNFKQFFKKKFKSILIPYFCLGLGLIIFECLINYHKNPFILLYFWRLVKKILVQNRVYSIWFLTSLFVLNFIFYAAVRILKTNLNLTISSILSIIIGCIYYKYIGKSLPWNIDTIFFNYPFFFLGYYYHQKENKIKEYFNNNNKYVILLVLTMVINFGFNYLNFELTKEYLDVFHNHYGIIPLAFISALFGIIYIILFSKLINIKIIKYLGKNSMLYFAWHQTIMIPISQKLLDILSIPKGVLYILLQLLFIIITLTILNEIITKSKLRFIIGKY